MSADLREKPGKRQNTQPFCHKTFLDPKRADLTATFKPDVATKLCTMEVLMRQESLRHLVHLQHAFQYIKQD